MAAVSANDVARKISKEKQQLRDKNIEVTEDDEDSRIVDPSNNANPLDS